MQQSKQAQPFQVGDTVKFDFPYADEGSKIRTCLVIHIDPESCEVVVAYGTSKFDPIRMKRSSLIIDDPADIEKSSLDKPTVFHVYRRLRVDPNDPRFKSSSKGQNRVLGRLPERLIEKVAQTYAWLPEISVLDERAGVHNLPATHVKERSGFLGRRKPRVLSDLVP